MTNQRDSSRREQSGRYWLSTGYWLLDLVLMIVLVGVMIATAFGAALGYLL